MAQHDPFAPETVSTGAMLSTNARDAVVRSEGLPEGILEVADSGWLTPDLPVLVRGAAKILPLAWRGDPGSGYNPYAEPKQIASFASRVQGACAHRAGPWTLLDLKTRRDDSIGSYTRALAAAGATRVDAWVFVEQGVGAALVWAGDEQAGTSSVSLHVVPPSWVHERGAEGAVEGIDVRWSWADVVDLAGRR